MTDTVTLKRLKVFAHHGVLQEEQRLGQTFLISVICELDLREAAKADLCDLSVNYAVLAERVNNLAKAQRFMTLEALAEALAFDVLTFFKRVNKVSIRVEKPQAPLPYAFETVEIFIQRSRETLHNA